jgi:AbrB family looped-hinge helix DNA binding protein
VANFVSGREVGCRKRYQQDAKGYLDIIKTVKLGARCQMALPAEIRKRLGLKEGDEIIIKINGEKAIIEPKPKSYAEHLWGPLGPGIKKDSPCIKVQRPPE